MKRTHQDIWLADDGTLLLSWHLDGDYAVVHVTEADPELLDELRYAITDALDSVPPPLEPDR